MCHACSMRGSTVVAAVVLMTGASARAEPALKLGPVLGFATHRSDDFGFAELRLELGLDRMLTEYIGLRGTIGGAFGGGGAGDVGALCARGLATAGVVFAFTNTPVVPDLFLFGGYGAGTFTGARVGGLLSARFYGAQHQSSGFFGIGSEYDWGVGGLSILFGLGFWL